MHEIEHAIEPELRASGVTVPRLVAALADHGLRVVSIGADPTCVVAEYERTAASEPLPPTEEEILADYERVVMGIDLAAGVDRTVFAPVPTGPERDIPGTVHQVSGTIVLPGSARVE